MSGKDYLIPCLHSHKPIDLVIILLGTNDLKHRFGVTAFDIAQGILQLGRMIQRSESGPGGKSPLVLILIPPPLGKLSQFSEMFKGGMEKSQGLSQQYKQVAELLACPYLDTSEHIVASDVDGVHFDASTHNTLGHVVAQKVKTILREKLL
jgi:lysophospholipase L1-like esterase